MSVEEYNNLMETREELEPQNKGGYGKPLGNQNETELTEFFKIKYRGIGIRVVYTIVHKKEIMNIIVVSLRTDEESYKEAEKRKVKYGESVHKGIFYAT
ncbi:type II toxin-antitoxin system RelE/ParE family toxin [Fusibacter ferrireducens]|uniref:type II toxin-antitoxin system RelE/ParE family toxin n=1 Tax=Fusibacter ferrireducens TaxID=2785058 RepID=UPI00226B0F68|nr:type II toxin-antitoxin system RelE/ParE family toxin [Fusibacter ferrireducens]